MTTAWFLRTQRLGFRRWSDADAPHALALWGDPEVTRLFGGPFSDDAIRARLEREIAQQETSGVQYWPENDDFVGCCGLRPCPHGERVYEIGFHLRPPFWGRGLAMEAAHAVITHAFAGLAATSLFAGHHPDNAASARLLEKLGFHYRCHEFYAPTGLMHPSYMLATPSSPRED